MIVCICNNLNEKAVEKAVQENCQTACEVWQFFQCKGQCGRCVSEIRKKVREKGLTLAE